MKHPIAALVYCTVIAGITAGGARAGVYYDHASLSNALQKTAIEHSDACKLFSLGSSRQGRDLWVLQLGRGDDAHERLAMAIVAGIDGRYPVSTAVAVQLADSLLSAKEGEAAWDLLATRTVFIIPCVNPDGAESFFATPQDEQPFALRPWDEDRDGLTDEDGPEDINGDGIITLMRVLDPEATHLPDPLEPRLMKKPDRAKGERPIFKIYPEGVDSDEDEEYNEDGLGGVDINRNFLHGYIDHSPAAGPHQISEPESRALIDFFLIRSQIAIAVFYGRYDNIVDPPKGDKTDDTKKAPVDLHKDDVDVYKQISEKYREITGMEKVPAEKAEGAVYAWAYAQYGIPSFACRVWTKPEAKKDKSKDEGDAGKKKGEPESESDAPQDEQDSDRKAPDMVADVNEKAQTTEAVGQAQSEESQNDKSSSTEENASYDEVSSEEDKDANKKAKEDKKKEKKKEPADKEAAEWLAYSDKERNGEGFVPWTRFTHPQLGSVEIGGFVPFFRTTPPESELDAIAEKQLQFVLDLGKRFPELSLAVPKVIQLSETVYEIETALVNDGYFPSGLAIAKQNRRVRPVVVTLDVPYDRILGAERLERIWAVPGSGGRRKLRWIVRGESGSVVTIRVTSEKYGDFTLDVTLTPSPQTKGGS